MIEGVLEHAPRRNRSPLEAVRAADCEARERARELLRSLTSIRSCRWP